MTTPTKFLNQVDQLHNENGPAITYYHDNGAKRQEEYRIVGLLHRENGPALIKYNEDGSIYLQSYFIGDIPCGPDDIRTEWFYPDGKIKKRKYILDYYANRNDKLDTAEYYKTGELKLKIFQHTQDSEPEGIRYFPSGRVKQKLYKKGYSKELNRDDGPARINFNEDGNIVKEEYMCAGQKHNTNGPAVIKYDKEGKVVQREFYNKGRGIQAEVTTNKKGELHSFDGPAVIMETLSYYGDGTKHEIYYNNGVIHREKLPAKITSCLKTGGILNETYFKDDKIHRNGAPALIIYKNNSDASPVLQETYYKDGKKHRDDGPAFIRYNTGATKVGNIYHEKYYIDNKEVDEEVIKWNILNKIKGNKPTPNQEILKKIQIGL